MNCIAIHRNEPLAMDLLGVIYPTPKIWVPLNPVWNPKITHVHWDDVLSDCEITISHSKARNPNETHHTPLQSMDPLLPRPFSLAFTSSVRSESDVPFAARPHSFFSQGSCGRLGTMAGASSICWSLRKHPRRLTAVQHWLAVSAQKNIENEVIGIIQRW